MCLYQSAATTDAEFSGLFCCLNGHKLADIVILLSWADYLNVGFCVIGLSIKLFKPRSKLHDRPIAITK